METLIPVVSCSKNLTLQCEHNFNQNFSDIVICKNPDDSRILKECDQNSFHNMDRIHIISEADFN